MGSLLKWIGWKNHVRSAKAATCIQSAHSLLVDDVRYPQTTESQPEKKKYSEQEITELRKQVATLFKQGSDKRNFSVNSELKGGLQTT